MTISSLNVALNSSIYTLAIVEFAILFIRAHRADLSGVCKLWIVFSATLIIGNLLVALQFHFIPLSELEHIEDKEKYLKAIINSSAVNSLPSLIFWYTGIPYAPLSDWRIVSAEQRKKEELKLTTWQQICLSCVAMNLFVVAIGFIALKTKI